MTFRLVSKSYRRYHSGGTNQQHLYCRLYQTIENEEPNQRFYIYRGFLHILEYLCGNATNGYSLQNYSHPDPYNYHSMNKQFYPHKG